MRKFIMFVTAVCVLFLSPGSKVPGNVQQPRLHLDRSQTREICEKQENYFKGKDVTFTFESLILNHYPVVLLTFFGTLL